MSNAYQWSIIIGFFLPPILAIIQQPRWPNWARAVVAFVVALIVSLGTLYFAGTLVFTGDTATPIVTAILLLFVTSITTYKGFCKPTGIAPSIEAASSQTPNPPSAPGSVVTVHVDDKPVLTIPAADPSPPTTPPTTPAP